MRALRAWPASWIRAASALWILVCVAGCVAYLDQRLEAFVREQPPPAPAYRDATGMIHADLYGVALSDRELLIVLVFALLPPAALTLAWRLARRSGGGDAGAAPGEGSAPGGGDAT